MADETDPMGIEPEPPQPDVLPDIGTADVHALFGIAGQREGNPTLIVGIGGGADVSMEQPGSFIGRYRLIEAIGEGGFGTVWRAEQYEPIHREVALKLIKPGMDSREIIARFEAERQALAMMEHPNIAAVLDAGTTQNGRPYFVMELVKGKPITECADERKLTIRQRLELFIPVCHAVQHAHQKAIIHRDLKPSNILIAEVDGKPVPKVIDFGIAKALGTSPEAALRATIARTLDGMVVGTPQYMSPEQAGSVPDVDTRSDIYTLGVILHELLTGQTPLSREQLRQAAFGEVLRLIREGQTKRPSSLVMPITEAVRLSATERASDPKKLGAALRGDLDWIVLKALEKERERRYDTANDLAEDLRRSLNDEPVSAGPPGVAYQLRKLIRRHKTTFIASAAVLLCLIGGIITTSVALTRETKAKEIARESATRAESREREKAKLLHDGSMADYAAALKWMEKDDRWGEGIAHLTRALDWEPSNETAATTLYGRVVFDAVKKSGGLRSVLAHPGGAKFGSWSPGGTRIVTVGGGPGPGVAQIWDAATGRPLGGPLHHEGEIHCASWSPDGTRIVTGSADKTARVWDVATGRSLGQPISQEGSIRSVNWSPDGARIITAGTYARIWDAGTGKPMSEPMRHGDEILFASFSPDGARILTSASNIDGGSRVWDAVTGKPLGKLMSSMPSFWFGQLQPASWNTDGTRIVTAGKDGVQVWDASASKALAAPVAPGFTARFAIWSPDGTHLLIYSYGSIPLVYDVATERKWELKSTKFDGSIVTASWSPDGRHIATQDLGCVQIWDAATGSPLGDPMRTGQTSHLVPGYSARWSPDGMQIFVACNGVALVWEVPGKKLNGEPRRHKDEIHAVAWSPDGKRILTASKDKTARVWDVATGRQVGEPIRHEDEVHDANWSADGTRVITACADKTARIWDAATGKLLGEPLQHKGAVLLSNWSPDGTRILTSSDIMVERPSIEAKQPAASDDALYFPPPPPFSTTITQLWDSKTRIPMESQMPISEISAIRSADWNPDGVRIVTVGENDIAQVWKVADWTTSGENMPVGPGAVANWSPDGTRIFSMSDDNIIQVWNPTTGRNVGKPKWSEDSEGVASARLSPDGTRLAIANGPNGRTATVTWIDPTVRIWEVKSLFNLPSEMPQWAREWVRAVAGWKFDAEGVMQAMAPEDRVKILYAPHDGDDSWSRLARWLATEPAKRTIHPDSQRTCREIAERERDFGSHESLKSALNYDPSVPLARLLMAGVLLNEDAGRNPSDRDPSLPQRAAFLRDYDMKRMPDDPALWSRAAEALHEQKDDIRARRALEKLATLDPGQAQALKMRLGL